MKTQEFLSLWDKAVDAQSKAEGLVKAKKGTRSYEARQLHLQDVDEAILEILGDPDAIEMVDLEIKTRKGGRWQVLHLVYDATTLKIPWPMLGENLQTKVREKMYGYKLCVNGDHESTHTKFEDAEIAWEQAKQDEKTESLKLFRQDEFWPKETLWASWELFEGEVVMPTPGGSSFFTGEIRKEFRITIGREQFAGVVATAAEYDEHIRLERGSHGGILPKIDAVVIYVVDAWGYKALDIIVQLGENIQVLADHSPKYSHAKGGIRLNEIKKLKNELQYQALLQLERISPPSLLEIFMSIARDLR